MNWISPVSLEGEFCRLLPLNIEHAEELAQAVADGEVWTVYYAGIPKPEEILNAIHRPLSSQEREDMISF